MTRVLTATVAALALFAAGCGSNNAGKIVGRWKAEKVDLPIGPVGPQDLVWEFGEDGAFTISWVNQETGVADTKVRGRYTLGLADTVKLTDLDPPLDGKTRAAEKVAIDGDTMTVGGAGKDQTYRFTRLPPR
jgi:hypothetical protein